MPRHSPTRRNRRQSSWGNSPVPAHEENIEIDLEPGEDPAEAPPGALEEDPDWRPATRNSRLPDWIPHPMQWILRISFRGGVLLLSLLLAICLFYLTLSFRYEIEDIDKMPERSVIYDIEGKELATLHGENRRLIAREEIPRFFVEALQAREDKRFFRHQGVDVMGLLRATMRNASDMQFTQGASTLTMQLARNSFALQEKSLHRKLLEIALSLRIEWNYSKDEILTAYVNRIYFGSGCHGLEEAARRYFGVSASQLNENQCALLVGIIRAPHACSPLRALEKALAQRDQVLARMVTEGELSHGNVDTIRETELGLRGREGSSRGGAALQAVRRHFEELLAEREIRDGGLRLRSTIHGEIQKLLETEVTDLLSRIPGEPEVAAICINSRTGGIRGIVGGRSSQRTTFNRALDARRDLGGVFTPFIYAAAAERGLQPRLEQPLTTGRDIGTNDLIRLAERFGFEGPFLNGDDLYRGGVRATPLEVATAAATLTGKGQRPRTHFLRDMRDSDLNVILPALEPSLKPMFVAGATEAALAMQFPDGEPRLLAATNPGKTDAWGVSFGSEHSLCIWIGHDQPSRLDEPDIILKEVHKTAQRLAESLLP